MLRISNQRYLVTVLHLRCKGLGIEIEMVWHRGNRPKHSEIHNFMPVTNFDIIFF